MSPFLFEGCGKVELGIVLRPFTGWITQVAYERSIYGAISYCSFDFDASSTYVNEFIWPYNMLPAFNV